jgi:GT2 family glycosyltransferase
MYASPDYVSKLVEYYQENSDKNLGCITPKLLQWKNFPESPEKIKQNTYDTTGINGSISHHFKERGHNQDDKGQYNKHPRIWGSSGASPMFDLKAIKDIQHQPGEYFDKNFFMYKEDIDLSYRLRWAGYEIHYTAASQAWHDRTGSDPGGIVKQVNERKKRANYIKDNSFLNHLQFVYKNWSPEYSFKTKFKTGIYLTKYIIYLLLFDPKVLKQYKKFKQLKPELLKKRQSMPRRISTKQMEQYLSNNFSQS